MSNHVQFTAAIDVQAKEGVPPRVAILAYTGGIMSLPGWGTIVVDLAGMELSPIPLLADHENRLGSIAGHGVPDVRSGQLHVDGVLAAHTPAGAQILALHRSGVQLQASIGAEVIAQQFIKAGETIRLNNRTLVAPPGGFNVTTKSKLREVSFVAAGADSLSSVSIAARMKGNQMKSTSTFEAWIQEMGFDAAALDAQQLAGLRANYSGRHAPNAADIQATAGHVPTISAEARIEAMTRGDFGAQQQHVGDLRLQALAGEIDMSTLCRGVQQAQLARFEASLPMAHTYIGNRHHGGGDRGQILEAALLLHMGHGDIAERRLGERAAQQAHDLGINSMIDLCRAAIQSTGAHAPSGRDEMIKAAFSTANIPGILSNVANKLMFASYQAFPSVARRVAKKLNANDFKAHGGYRLSAASTFEKIGNAGEIKHGSLAESTYSFSVSTYGKMFGLTRQDIINDDLGTFDSMPQQIGRGGAEAIEDAFWTLVLANTGNFFSAGNNNYFEGGSTNLQASSLDTAVATLMKQTDENGKPISVMPWALVVPPELKATADGLYVARTLNVGGGVSGADLDTRIPAENIYFGRYTPMPTPYLSNSSYSGSSATAWYLFGNPADVAAFGIAYLNGQENPVVETENAPFNTLGVQMRGYIDFGVCQIDYRGAAKSKGAA